MMAASLTEEAWFRSFRAGDRAAGEALFNALARPIAAVCWALSGDCLAEEAAQETFLRVAKGVDTFQDGLPHRPWIFQIARGNGPGSPPAATGGPHFG